MLLGLLAKIKGIFRERLWSRLEGGVTRRSSKVEQKKPEIPITLPTLNYPATLFHIFIFMQIYANFYLIMQIYVNFYFIMLIYAIFS